MKLWHPRFFPRVPQCCYQLPPGSRIAGVPPTDVAKHIYIYNIHILYIPLDKNKTQTNKSSPQKKHTLRLCFFFLMDLAIDFSIGTTGLVYLPTFG